MPFWTLDRLGTFKLQLTSDVHLIKCISQLMLLHLSQRSCQLLPHWMVGVGPQPCIQHLCHALVSSALRVDLIQGCCWDSNSVPQVVPPGVDVPKLDEQAVQV